MNEGRWPASTRLAVKMQQDMGRMKQALGPAYHYLDRQMLMSPTERTIQRLEEGLRLHKQYDDLLRLRKIQRLTRSTGMDTALMMISLQDHRLHREVSYLGRVARERADRIVGVNSLLDSIHSNQTFMDTIAVQRANIDFACRFDPISDIQDRISRLSRFSGSMHSFFREHVEDLPEGEVPSEHKPTDEEQQQIEDLFRELEEEEIADEVEFLERLQRKILAMWNSVPGWMKGALVTVLYDLMVRFIFPYLLICSQSLPSQGAAHCLPVVSKQACVTLKQLRKMGVALPDNCRVVIARVLVARETQASRSGLRGRLLAGNPVMMIEKGRHWSLVEYHNEDTGVEIQGWVFTRYLRKVDPQRN